MVSIKERYLKLGLEHFKERPKASACLTQEYVGLGSFTSLSLFI